jgi:hypothetical protein
MKKLFALLLWLICLHSTKGQKNFELPETSIKVAYMGSVTYPGFKVGIEIPTKVIPVEKQRSWGTKTILKERYWTLNVGFYHHPGFHDNLYFLAERQFRRQYNSGFFTEFSPGLGFSRTFLGGATYTLADDGTVSKKSLAGYNYLMVSVAGSIGYDLSKQLDIPLKIYLKPSFFALAPYNSTKYMRPTYEIGMAFPLGSR